jgi:LmbE family N-acetylglucosaminyl deacetylase
VQVDDGSDNGVTRRPGLRGRLARLWRRPWVRWPLTLTVAAAVFYYTFKPTTWRPGPWELLSLRTVDVSARQRVLVVSPHCDDETLGAAGLILNARRGGEQVKVAFVTNGDGFRFATVEHFHEPFPSAGQYVGMGRIRQNEARSALGKLGVDDIVFMGYPDRGVASLWTHYWSHGEPYRSPFIRQSRSPYPDTYNPDAVYCGDDLLGDLRRLLHDYRPDLVVYPQPNDVHTDHWAVSAFTRLALALETRADPTFAPDTLCYLVHRPDFPHPRGMRPEVALLPPPPLRAVVPDWLRIDLPEEDRQTKFQALSQYASQLAVTRRMLLSFVRRDECFTREVAVNLPLFGRGDPARGDTWRDPAGRPLAPVRRDPVRDGVVHDAFGSADLVALYAARRSDGALMLCAQVRKDPKPTFDYVLRVLTYDAAGAHTFCAGHSLTLRSHRPTCATAGRYFSYTLPADEFGQPQEAFVSAEVDAVGGRAEGIQLNMLDQVGWTQLNVGDGRAPAGGRIPQSQR